MNALRKPSSEIAGFVTSIASGKSIDEAATEALIKYGIAATFELLWDASRSWLTRSSTAISTTEKAEDAHALSRFVEQTRERLHRLEESSASEPRLEALLLDHQFWRLQRNYEFEWMRAPMDERKRMLEFAAAGAVNVDMTIGELARVERVLREADPGDARLLYALENLQAPPVPEPRFGPEDQEARWLNSARIELAAKSPVETSALEAAGCIRVVEHVPGPFQSGEGVTVTALGRLALKVLDAYLRT